MGIVIGNLIQGAFFTERHVTRTVPVVKQASPKQDFIVGEQVCTWDKARDTFLCMKRDVPQGSRTKRKAYLG